MCGCGCVGGLARGRLEVAEAVCGVARGRVEVAEAVYGVARWRVEVAGEAVPPGTTVQHSVALQPVLWSAHVMLAGEALMALALLAQSNAPPVAPVVSAQVFEPA